MSQEAEHNASNTPLTVFLMFLEMLTSMCMQEVVHLGIADLLRDGPRSVGALAQEVGVQDDSLLLLLRVLCSREVFVETEMGVFAHTEKSRYLQSDTVGSMVGIGEMFRSDWFRKIWTPEGLTYALQTGKTAFEHVFGESFWAYATKYPTAYSTFSRGMTSSSASQSEGLAQALDVTGLHSLVDVGGGEGSFLSTLLLRHPEMKGILFDTPPVIKGAQTLIAQAGLTDRCTCIAGDFFQSIPQGSDAYLLKRILHDWSDEDCLRILYSCRRAIAPSGKLFIVDYILPEPPDKPSPYIVVSMSIRLLLASGGGERTEQQFRNLLNKAGFELVSITPTKSPQSILEARVQD